MKILSLDIGGTEVKYGYFDDYREDYGKFAVIDSDGIELLPQKIITFIRNYEVDYIGVCAPGPFDFKTGTGLMEHKLKSLYKVSLKEIINKEYPGVKTLFIHDATAFALGAIEENHTLKNENFAAVMLGTGLGYVNMLHGKAYINDKETPKYPLWNSAYKTGIAENYVSATAIVNRANGLKYSFSNALEVANAAKNGDYNLIKLFYEIGLDMGKILCKKQETDHFSKLLIGGQVSRSWDLLKGGFESVCNVEYSLINNPTMCAVKGIKYCVENGKKNIYYK